MRIGTVDDVAALLKISTKTVYDRAQLPVSEGGIPTLRRIGPALRFDLDECERWMREVDAQGRERSQVAS